MCGCGKVKPEVARMIRMDQYSFIRTAHRVYGKSIRQISRETGTYPQAGRRPGLAGIKAADTGSPPVLK